MRTDCGWGTDCPADVGLGRIMDGTDCPADVGLGRIMDEDGLSC